MSAFQAFSVKWYASVNQVKDLFNELGVNFLPNFYGNDDSSSNQQTADNVNKFLEYSANNQTNQLNEVKSEHRSIDDLSDELMLKVFGYLSIRTLLRCRQVSKKWSRVSSDNSLWKFIDLSKYWMSYSDLENILKLGVNGIRLFDTHITTDLCNYHELNSIEYLDLSLANISVKWINALLDSNANELSLKKLSLDSLCIDNSTLDIIATKHKQLSVLNMSMCSTYNNSEQLVFKQSLPLTLNELNLGGIQSLDIDQMLQVLPKSLSRLNMSGLKLKVEHADALAIMCPNLIELDITDCGELTGHMVRNSSDHSIFITIYRSDKSGFFSTIARPNASHSNKDRPAIWGINLLI